MFEKILLSTGTYSDYEIELFEKSISLRQVGKKEVLLREGQVAKSVSFIVEGAVFQYRHNIEHEREIIELNISNEWFFNHASLTGQKPSELFIEAFTESIVLEVSLDVIHYLTGKSLAFLQLNRILEGAVSRLQFFDHAMTPMEKYQFVLKTRPQLVQLFPLKMIASYLKISPETLSRVREKITRE